MQFIARNVIYTVDFSIKFKTVGEICIELYILRDNIFQLFDIIGNLQEYIISTHASIFSVSLMINGKR